MPSIALEIAVIVLLIVANGGLAMAETAMVAARKVRLQQRAEAGLAGAQTALELLSKPSGFLSTVQIGITAIGVLAGAFSGATVAEKMEDLFLTLPRLAPYAEAISVAIVVLLITYLSLVIGELVPKQIALNAPERVAAWVAPALRALSRIAAPAVHLLGLSSSALLRLLRVRPAHEPEVTEDEIRMLIGQGARAGVFEPLEDDLVGGVFRLADLSVEAIMTPRVDIHWLEVDSSPEGLRQQIETGGQAYYPVAQGGLDNVLGMVSAQDMLSRCLAGQPVDLRSLVRPALFVPESVPALEVVERLQQTRSRIALVLDEFGGIHGLVTTSDLLEAIVGEFPEVGEAPEVVRRADGSWLMDGTTPTEAVTDLLGIRHLPGQRRRYFHTLGGFIMSHLGRIPAAGDSIQWGGFQFEVVDMDRLRIDKVLIIPQRKNSDR